MAGIQEKNAMNPFANYILGPLGLAVLFFFGAVSTAVLTPLIISLARRIGAIDQGGYRKANQGGVPLLGGLSIGLPLLAVSFLLAGAGSLIVRNWEVIIRLNREWLDPLMTFASNRESFSGSFLVLSIGGVAILGLGLLDDIRGMRARYKFLGQIAVAVFICATGHVLQGFYIPFIGGFPLSPQLGVIFSLLWIVGMINAFNLIDGLDGLAAGIALIASVALVVLGMITGNTMIALICLPLAGSLAAFLLFNSHPARIFLGDTGSMFLGYILATVTLMGTYKSETFAIILGPALTLSFPIFETLVSMARRFVRGVPIFSGDGHHTHHRLLRKGFSKRQVVLILYGVTLLLAVAAVLSQLIPAGSGWEWSPPTIFLGVLLGVAWWVGYLRRETIGRIFYRRRRNTVLAAFSRYAIQSLTCRSAVISPREILNFCRRELGLCFLAAWFEEGRVMIGFSGKPVVDDKNRKLLDSIERLRVKTVSGLNVIIRYQFAHEPGENEFEDVTACLAGIFEKAGVNLLLKKAVSLQNEREDRSILDGIEREMYCQSPDNH